MCFFSDHIKKFSFLRINNVCLLGLTLNWIHHNTDMILTGETIAVWHKFSLKGQIKRTRSWIVQNVFIKNKVRE